eukprot:5522830-Karenia_brevis.AAC.1
MALEYGHFLFGPATRLRPARDPVRGPVTKMFRGRSNEDASRWTSKIYWAGPRKYIGMDLETVL